MRAELADAVAQAADDDAVRVVLVTGEGGAFATGIEPPVQDGPPGAGSILAALAKPTIAYIDGECLDMGLELALACDVRYASEASTFGMRQVHGGSLPWDGGTQRLARAVGRGHALRLLLTGEVIDGREAARIGLVQRIATLDDAKAWAQRVAEGAPIAAAYAKEAATAGLDLTLDQGLRLEADLSVLLQSTGDRKEGLASFREKRKPRFEGR